jgi:hypothetical protein
MRVVTETVTIVRTYCECGTELFSANDASRHRRQHLLEHYQSTAEGRRTLEMLRGMGFKNQPDSWLRLS